MKIRKFPPILLPGLLFISVFLLLPIGVLILYSLSVSSSTSLDLSAPTLANYVRIITVPVYRKVIFNTVVIAFQTTVITFIISYFPALYLAKTKNPYKPLFFLLFLIPFWTPYVVRMFSWIAILLRQGVLNQILLALHIINEPQIFLFSRVAVLVVLVYSSIPFMVAPIFASISLIKDSYVEAAHDLGATQFETFRHVILPLSLPGVWSGCVVTFMLNVGSFLAPSIVGGPADTMISQLIVDRFLFLGHWASGAAISVIFIITILTIVYFANRVIPLEKMFKV